MVCWRSSCALVQQGSATILLPQWLTMLCAWGEQLGMPCCMLKSSGNSQQAHAGKTTASLCQPLGSAAVRLLALSNRLMPADAVSPLCSKQMQWGWW